jgi:hypothetical protein
MKSKNFNENLINFYFVPMITMITYISILDYYFFSKNIILNNFSYFFFFGASISYILFSKDFQRILKENKELSISCVVFKSFLAFTFWIVVLINYLVVSIKESVEQEEQEEQIKNYGKTFEEIESNYNNEILLLKGKIEDLTLKNNKFIDIETKFQDTLISLLKLKEENMKLKMVKLNTDEDLNITY